MALHKKIRCSGRSMQPLFRHGDILHVIPYSDSAKIRTGDVVVFCSPEGRQIVHRVILATAEGLRTKGDNNEAADHFIIQPDIIAGRVVSLTRGSGTLRVFGGTKGIMQARALQGIHTMRAAASRNLTPFYRRLSGPGIFRHILPLRLRPRVLCFQRPEGREMQLLMGRTVIGRCFAGQSEWHIKKPFHLFVNESELPKGSRIA